MRFSKRTIQGEILLSDSLKLFSERMNLGPLEQREALKRALKEAVGEFIFDHIVLGEVRQYTITVYTDSQSCYQSIVLKKSHFENSLNQILDDHMWKLIVMRNKMLT